MDPNQVTTAAAQVASTPIYLDWTFWAFVVALIAVVLSQLPPLYAVLRRAKLDVEAYSYILLTHTAGNPNVQLHLILANVGGGAIKVTNITLTFQRGDRSFTVSAKNYLARPNDTQVIMFTSQTLKPDQEWGHVINFLNFFSKDEEREYRQLRFNLRNDIRAKRKLLEDKDQFVYGDPSNVAPLMKFFEKRFVWEPGEYRVTLRVVAEPAKVSLERAFRFTLFESDAQLLRDHSKSYSAGGGIFFTDPDLESVVTPLIAEGH